MVWFWLLAVILNLFLACTKGDPLPHSTCERTFEKVGCFVDKTGQKGTLRTLPDLLVNDRDPNSDAYDGHRLDWHKWPESIHSLACRCANATRIKGWKVFGLQFYGECWSGKNGETEFNKYGQADPKKCVQELVNPIPPCNKTKDMECVGAQSTNYIYLLKDLKPADVNGGYSMWSQWTECSKSCGGGTRVRERTCTDPPPAGNGNDCAHLGEAEEKEECNKAPCPDPCKKSLDVGLIIDGSGSVGSANFKKALDFLADLVGHLAVSSQGTHVGVIVYQSRATLHFNLANSDYHNLSRLQAAIRALSYPGGGTRTDLALEMASNQIFSPAGGDRADASNVLVVLTDGKTNRGSRKYKDVLAPLQKKGVRTVAVGVGRSIDGAELLEIAAGNPNYVTHVNDFDDLKTSLQKILLESCQGAGDVDGAWSDWSNWTQCSKSCGGGVKARERSCTNPPPKGNGQSCSGEVEETVACSENPCPKPCTKALDVGIILDGSGSVRSVNFKKAKEFVQSLIGHFTVSPNATHLGIITYSTNPTLEFDFANAKYHDIVELKKRVMTITYPGGWTRTDKALEMAAQKLFTDAGGDRKDKPNVLVVLTDGKTNRGSKPYPEVLRPLQARGVRTVAVGIGHGINQRELLQIAMNDNQYVVRVDNFDALKGKLQMILDESCQGSPPPTPSPACREGALGLQSGDIPDNAITVSSQWDGNHGPDRARLNQVKSGVKVGAWSAKYNDKGQWIQVDLGKIVKITKVMTQGRSDSNQWVTSYWLSYSINNGLYQAYSENKLVILTGNTDRNTVKINVLHVPIYTRYIRLHPASFHGHISLRLELYGCKTGFVPPSPPLCMNALGMQSGHIKPGALQASSQYDSNHGPDNGRLHFQKTGSRVGAWSAKTNDANQWIQAKFDVVARVRRVSCQGRMDSDQWVKTYTLAYSFDGNSWKDYKLNGKLTEFQGNIDRYAVATEIINPPIVAQYVRVKPKTWHGHISMRLEFYGCTEDGDICNVHKPCKNGAQCTNVVGGYQCKCPAGFMGKNCDQDIDECALGPCKNGGNCTNTAGGYNCSCVGGWFTGKNCDEAPTECIVNTKLSEANRASGNLRRSCLKCDSRHLPTIGKWHQFVGDAGTKMPNSCVPTQRCGTHAPGWMHGEHPKKGDGVVTRKVCFHWSNNCCRWSVNIQVRNCGGYYVYKLEKPPACYLRFCGDKGHNICEPKNPCQNGGTCKPQGESYYCQCIPGYQGKNCDKDINECAVNSPCKNGGTCTNTPGSYICTCGAKFTGRNCETDVNECTVHRPCKNGATCVNTVGGYSCRCPANYKGKHCDEDVDECTATPCKNGGNCVNSVGSYRCICVGGWFIGKHCDQDPTECSSYSSLNTADRAAGSHRGRLLKCDRNDFPSVSKWYRFEGAAGTRMPTSPVPENHCGTHAAGWLDGQHPSKADGVVKRKVCFNWSGNRCRWSIYVSVRNCGAFYVYHLGRTPGCSFRYCGNKGHNVCRVQNPCKNGATCMPNGDGATCRCTANYEGAYCDKDVDECATVRPCKNGGQCRNTRGGYICTCARGFSGKNCDQVFVPHECKSSTYVVNSDMTRSKDFNGGNLYCDQRNLPTVGKWHRFMGAAGNVMPTSCVPVNRCGTHAPGWLQGGHPTEEQGVVTRKVCFHWTNNCCRWNTNIKVRNCGEFYVYQLPKTPVCSLRYCTEKKVPHECKSSTYVVNSDKTRSKDFNGGNLYCDQRNLPTVGKWHRFMGAAGNAMPTSCVPANRCGTHAPGWLQGGHPTEEQGIVTRKVCFHWTNNCCRWNTNIRVRNCGEFYVYQLPKTPVCYLRYCTEKKVFVPHECKSSTYVVNSDKTRSKDFNGGNLYCDQRNLPTVGKWHRFMGAAGNAMPTACVPANRCGTHAPGWLQGGHPTEEQGVVTRKVCFHWTNNCCRWNTYINVRNCGEFYVYQLPKTPVCHLRYCTEKKVPHECKSSTYVVNSDKTRSKDFNGGNLYCDQRNLPTVGKWHRFMGAAGNVMPTSCVPANRCGTHAPGWLQGGHPTEEQGVVTRKVCFHWTNNCCRWNTNIKVRNCGEFYVYQLPKTPVCSLRYCTEKKVPDECKSSTYVVNSDKTRSKDFNGGNLYCDQRNLPTVGKWHRFMGAAGNAMPTSCVPANRCGTHAPGWLQGGHPTEEQGVVTRKVCFHWTNNCCRWNTNIRVRNCGEFYVYQLPKTPVCYLRYCTEKKRSCC